LAKIIHKPSRYAQGKSKKTQLESLSEFRKGGGENQLPPVKKVSG